MTNGKSNACEKDYREFTGPELVTEAKSSMDNIVRLMERSDKVNGCDAVSDNVMAAITVLENDLPLYESYIDGDQVYWNHYRVKELWGSIRNSLKLVDEVLCLEQEKIKTYIEEENDAKRALRRAQHRTQTDLGGLARTFTNVDKLLIEQLPNQDTCQLNSSITIMRDFGFHFNSLPLPGIIPSKPVIDPMSMAIGAISSGATLLLIYLCLARHNPIISGCYSLGARLGIFRRRAKGIADPAETRAIDVVSRGHGVDMASSQPLIQRW
jgi:hypothetical protein